MLGIYVRFRGGVDGYIYIYIGCGPLTVTVTTRIITFLVGDPYKPRSGLGLMSFSPYCMEIMGVSSDPGTYGS